MFLHSGKGYSCRRIAAIVKISKSSVSRILKADSKVNKNEKNELGKIIPGRPCLLSVCSERKLCRSVSRLRLTNPKFTALVIVQDCGIDRTMAKYRTFVCYWDNIRP
jgi:transposase